MEKIISLIEKLEKVHEVIIDQDNIVEYHNEAVRVVSGCDYDDDEIEEMVMRMNPPESFKLSAAVMYLLKDIDMDEIARLVSINQMSITDIEIMKLLVVEGDRYIKDLINLSKNE